MKLILTVDTEADNQWETGASLTTTNLEHVPRFQALCERFEFPPTYLCTYEVVTSTAFNETLRHPMRAGRAEIGAHLYARYDEPPVLLSGGAWHFRGPIACPFTNGALDRLFRQAGWLTFRAGGQLMGKSNDPTLHRLLRERDWCFFAGDSDTDR